MNILPGETPYHVHHGDCIEHLATLPAECIDASIYSPPFPQVYAYTSLESDLGNTEDLERDAPLHFGFFFRQMVRAMKPGRVMIVHCTQIVRMRRTGGEGIFDFRGLLIRLARRAGFIYEYDWLVPVNPQAQAIKTKSRSLQFAGLEADRAQSRGALGEILIKFVAPGENVTPINTPGQVTRNQWIEYAEGAWANIPRINVFGDQKIDTLNTAAAKSEDDVRHICPLRLGIIDRFVRMYSNPGELVFSPFTGIGSEGAIALMNDRKFYGCELKDEYHAQALINIERAIAAREGSKSVMLPGFAGDAEDDDDTDDAEVDAVAGSRVA